MAESEIKHMYRDIEELKRDVSIIKYILSEEGELTENAKKRLAKSRKTPLSKYVKL